MEEMEDEVELSVWEVTGEVSFLLIIIIIFSSLF